MQSLFYSGAFGVVIFWTVVLLYGLLRDQSMRSKIIRITIVGIIWSFIPSGSWSSFRECAEFVGRSYPVWFIMIAALLIPIYLSGFFRLVREKKAREVV